MQYFKKFAGKSGAVPKAPDVKAMIFVWFGALLAASVVGALAFYSKQPLVLGSFGASIFVLFILPETPFAQPRNVIGGHFVSSFVGVAFYHWVGPEWWSMALALATALTLMQVLRVPHPPAGSNPFIVFLSGAHWDFLFTPTLLGAVALVLVALFYLNSAKKLHYPNYWF